MLKSVRVNRVRHLGFYSYHVVIQQQDRQGRCLQAITMRKCGTKKAAIAIAKKLSQGMPTHQLVLI